MQQQSAGDMQPDLRPASHHGLGRAGRLLIFRVRPGEDLVPTLIERCRAAELRSGVIVACIGSLARAALVSVKPDAKPGDAYSPPMHLEGPLEFIGGQGYVSLFPDSGPMTVHLHGQLSDSTFRHVSGHFLAEGNIALFTLEVTVLEVTGLEVRRIPDETGVAQLTLVGGLSEG